ncbi:thioredoxin [Protofrankia symbiont of Coriaria ruscifolia]|uniref:thioredoxin n=1 Tax=Protofrankia symbiont of Coriaria ruscifolia TaxID=1306542 RepID=UPI0010415F2E|nr:thioredoxin [Protofrankia symbiont of Coriaria ruscifolia]
MIAILEKIVADDEDVDEDVDEVTDRTFGSEVLASAGPVLVDFWADWCLPCRMMAPILKEIAVELGDKLRIVKLDIGENPETAEQHRIESIPAMVVYVNGQEVERIVGARSKAELLRELSPWIR